jgi:hypothetical protein
MKVAQTSVKLFLAGILFLGVAAYFNIISDEIHRYDYNLQDFQRSEVTDFTISGPYKKSRNFAGNLGLIFFILSSSSFLAAFWISRR